MTDRIEEIRKRLAEATPGPWRPCPHKMFVFGPRHEMIASTSHGDEEYGAERGTVEIRGAGAGLPMDENHDLIVNAPADLAFLLEVNAKLTRELAEAREAFHDATRLRSQIQQARIKAEDERDAARQERDAMKAMMPKPPYDADTLERAARGTYADRTVRGMARALLRLSPPSAPAQNITSDDVCNDAAWLLDPKTPIADVYAELRSMGVDPEAVAERGAAFVADLMAKKAPAQSRALDAERTQLEVDDD